MSPRTKEQYDSIRESRKNLIMDTALELFANNGYHATSISIIAQKAGISKGLLYNYFKSKEKLLIEILSSGLREFTDELDLDKDGVITDEEFIHFIDLMFKTLKAERDYWRLYFSVILQPAVLVLIKDQYRSILETTLNMMEAYFRKKGNKNPRMQALIFGSLLDGIGINYIMDSASFNLKETKKIIINNFLNLNKHEK